MGENTHDTVQIHEKWTPLFSRRCCSLLVWELSCRLLSAARRERGRAIDAKGKNAKSSILDTSDNKTHIWIMGALADSSVPVRMNWKRTKRAIPHFTILMYRNQINLFSCPVAINHYLVLKVVANVMSFVDSRIWYFTLFSFLSCFSANGQIGSNAKSALPSLRWTGGRFSFRSLHLRRL